MTAVLTLKMGRKVAGWGRSQLSERSAIPETSPAGFTLAAPADVVAYVGKAALVLYCHCVRIHCFLSRDSLQSCENAPIVSLVALHCEPALLVAVRPR
jgi:hypothetical protein